MNDKTITFKTFSTFDDFTVKLSTSNLILLSKFLSELKAHYKADNTSSILHNHETKQYFVFIHFSNDEIAEKLQEVSAFP